MTSTTELQSLMNEAKAHLATAIKDGAARVAASMRGADTAQPPNAAEPPDEALAFLERMRRDLADAWAAYASRSADQRHEDMRFICDVLALHRGCARMSCRRSQRCRGDAMHCRARHDVPKAVEHYAAAQLLGTLAPWLPPRGTQAQREAYAAWIAGMKAAGR